MEAALVLLGLLLLSGGSDSPGGGGDLPHAPATREALDDAIDRIGLAPDVGDFLRLVAYRESKFHSNVGAGVTTGAPPWATIHASAGEASAAGRAYDRVAGDLFAGSPWPRERYAFGTGGFFGMMPSYGLAAFRGSALLPRADPWLVFDPMLSVVMALAFASRLQGHASYQRDPTFLRLRNGWANLNRMASDSKVEASRAKYSADARAAGIDPAFLDRKPPRIGPQDWAALARTLVAGLEV